LHNLVDVTNAVTTTPNQHTGAIASLGPSSSKQLSLAAGKLAVARRIGWCKWQRVGTVTSSA